MSFAAEAEARPVEVDDGREEDPDEEEEGDIILLVVWARPARREVETNGIEAEEEVERDEAEAEEDIDEAEMVLTRVVDGVRDSVDMIKLVRTEAEEVGWVRMEVETAVNVRVVGWSRVVVRGSGEVVVGSEAEDVATAGTDVGAAAVLEGTSLTALVATAGLLADTTPLDDAAFPPAIPSVPSSKLASPSGPIINGACCCCCPVLPTAAAIL